MEPVTLYKNKYVVGLSDVDFTKKLKVSTLFGFFQDIASLAAENLGVGINALEKNYDLAWILMRIRVDIERYPAWNEEITIETWPQVPKRLEFERDFIVRDAEGYILAKAVTTWIIMDIKTREMQKTELVAVKYPYYITERAIDCRLGKLKPNGQPEVAYKKVIGYSDVDINGHLNNSKYIDYIMDCFSMESHKKYGVKSIEVNYLNEALPGDELILYKDISALDANQVYIEGLNGRDEKPVFKTILKISENKQEQA